MDEELEIIIKEATDKARALGYAEGYLAGYIDREIEVQRILANGGKRDERIGEPKYPA